MPRRRRDSRRPAVLARPATRPSYQVQPLECRRMFTTMLGAGGVGATRAGNGVFEYLDATGATVRIAYFDVLINLTGVLVSTTPVDVVSIADLQPAVLVPPTGPFPNLFRIDVLQSSLDSFITIADVPPLVAPPPSGLVAARPDEPFAGTAGPFLVNNASNVGPAQILFSPPADSGGVLLGAKHNGPLDTNVPIVSVPDGSGGTVTAGVYMSPTEVDPTTGSPVIDPTTGLQVPNDLGNFFFGGTILGNLIFAAPAPGTVPAEAANAPVSQGGNVGTFYAGAILTGDATGAFQAMATSASDQTPNFLVGGDLRDLVTSGAIGGDAVASSPDVPQYITGFDLQVAGTVGEIHQREGSLYGTVTVEHDPAVYGLPSDLLPEQELEVLNKGGADGDIFEGNPRTGAIPRLPATEFSNDTEANPQYLGTVRQTNPATGVPLTTTTGQPVYEATVNGVVQASDPNPEAVDFYAVPLVAGQTITVQATTGKALAVVLVDPEGRAVESDLSTGFLNTVLDQPMQYTATQAGEYRLAVVLLTADPPADYPYTLTVQGVGDLAIGTMASAGNIYDDGFDTGFSALRGDWGAFVAAGTISSGTTGPTDNASSALVPVPPPTSIFVPDGNLRAVTATDIGVATSADATNATTGIETGSASRSPVILDVPNGIVGLLQATDASTLGILAVETRFDADNASATTSPTPYSAVGGDFQMIDGAGTVYLEIATNGSVGDVLAGNMATDMPGPSFIEVDANNVSHAGRIDLIDCRDDLGTSLSGGPGLVTNDGGDVRYIKVGGYVFRDAFFGPANFPDATLYSPGESVPFTDDSGATITLTPIGNVAANPDYNAAIAAVDPSILPTVGPQLVITDYPVRGSGGSVLINVSVGEGSATDPTFGTAATDGLLVTATGGAAGSVAEIGRVQIEGGTAAFAPTTLDAASLPSVTGPAGLNIGIAGIPGLAVSNTTTTPTATGSNNGTTSRAGGAGTSGATGGAANSSSGSTTVVAAAAADAVDPSLVITGQTQVDVLDVVVTALQNPQLIVSPGSDVTGDPFGDANNVQVPTLANAAIIENNTPNGQLSTVLSSSIGTIFSRGTLGVASSSTAEAVLPSDPLSNGPTLIVDAPGSGGLGRFSTEAGSGDGGPVGEAYPFDDQKTGITADGSIENVYAFDGLGNVQVNQVIENINPNDNGKDNPGYFSGIIGPIVAGENLAAAIGNPADLINVSIGQGIGSSGTGDFAQTGLFAGESIENVFGESGADIRGTVDAQLSIDNITLTNGSLIDADILAIQTRVMDASQTGPGQAANASVFVNDFAQASPLLSGLFLNQDDNFPEGVISNPLINLGNLTIRGDGGIIGTVIATDNIGVINDLGFGILNSIITTSGTDEIEHVVAAGYGIRQTSISAGSDIGTITATGNGADLPVTSVSADVRLSDTSTAVDPFTGLPPDALTDIYAALGVAPGTVTQAGRTDTGVLEDVDVTGELSLGVVQAQTLRVSEPLNTPVTLPLMAEPNIPLPTQVFPTEFNFGQSIGRFLIRGLIDGAEITTGTLGSFVHRGNVNRLGITVSGLLRSLAISGNFGQSILDTETGRQIPDSFLRVVGANAVLNKLTVAGSLFANVTSAGSIGTITVGGSVIGTITAEGLGKALSLGELKVGGTLSNGGLNVMGSVGTIMTAGSLGAAGDTLTIGGSVKSLIVGANHAPGAVLGTALTVDGALGSATINGQVTAPLHVLGSVGSLAVIGNAASPNAVSAAIQIDGNLKIATISNGNLAANLTVNDVFGTLSLVRGSIAAAATVSDLLGSLTNVRVTGGTPYGIQGSILLPAGTGLNLSVTGNVGGNGASTISALTAGTIVVVGTIEPGATLSFVGQVNALTVDGDLSAGASVTGHPIRRHTVRGATVGTLTAV